MPSACAGTVVRSWVELTNMVPVPNAPPKETVAFDWKFDPKTLATMPPAPVDVSGETTEGAGGGAIAVKEKPADKLRIRSIRHPDRKIESHVPVGVTPIGHSGGDELGIRNDDGNVVVGDDRGRPYRDVHDIAGDRADFDAVADFDGAFDEKDEPADEIIGDVLQAEADPDAEGSGQDRHGTQVDAGRLEDHDQADGNDDVADDCADRQSDSQFHAALGEEACDDPDLQPAGDGEEEKNENDQYNERP